VTLSSPIALERFVVTVLPGTAPSPVWLLCLLGDALPRRYIVIAMSAELVIRLAMPGENDSIHALVQTIANETFAYLFAPCQVPIDEANWFSAWLAISEEEMVGGDDAR
jgi:hypothetical protein